MTTIPIIFNAEGDMWEEELFCYRVTTFNFSRDEEEVSHFMAEDITRALAYAERYFNSDGPFYQIRSVTFVDSIIFPV